MQSNGTNISFSASELSEMIVSRFLEQVKNPEVKLRPIYILGHAGVGKSQIVRQASRLVEKELKELKNNSKLSVDCKVVSSVFLEPPEWMGLAHIAVDSSDKEEMTVFARPSLIPKTGYGVIFLDEANRANKEIKSGLLTLIEDREINGHKLGDGWIIVLAGNPANDRYQGATDFDPALLDRVCPVWFKGDAKETVKYLKSKYPNHFLVDFLEEHPTQIDFEAKSRCTPRGWEYAIRATRNIKDNFTRTNKELVNLLGCELGLEATTQILSIISQKIRDLSIEDILNDKEKTVKFLKDNRNYTDIISIVEKKTREEIFKTLKTYSRQKEIDGVALYPEVQAANLIAFMENLPPENLLTMLRSIEDDGTFDFNLEYVFGTTFTKKSEQLKNFVIKLYESGNETNEGSQKSP